MILIAGPRFSPPLGSFARGWLSSQVEWGSWIVASPDAHPLSATNRCLSYLSDVKATQVLIVSRHRRWMKIPDAWNFHHVVSISDATDVGWATLLAESGCWFGEETYELKQLRKWLSWEVVGMQEATGPLPWDKPTAGEILDAYERSDLGRLPY